jgi:hypothetical protein
LQARVKGAPYIYELVTQIDGKGIHVQERAPGLRGHKSLLIPYLRDGGWPDTTQVKVDASMVRFALGAEKILFEIEGVIEQYLDLPYGYENRRGLCGLLRLDLAEPGEGIHYHIAIEA